MKKKLLLLFCLLVTAGSAAWAEIAHGDCKNGSWVIDNSGKLTVNINGKMKDYGEGKAPWYQYAERIKAIHISSGCKNIGRNGFYGLYNVESVTGGENVESVAMYAFQNCGGGEREWSNDVQGYVSAAKPIPQIYFPKCSYVGECAFAGCAAIAISLPLVETWKVAAITGDQYTSWTGQNYSYGCAICDIVDLGSKTKKLRPGSLMGPRYVFCQSPTPPEWERLYDRDERDYAAYWVGKIITFGGIGSYNGREYEYPFGDNKYVNVIVPKEYLQAYIDYYPQKHPEVESGYMCARFSNNEHSKNGWTASNGELHAGAPIYKDGKLIGGWYTTDLAIRVILTESMMPVYDSQTVPWKSVLGSKNRLEIEILGDNDNFTIPANCFKGGKGLTGISQLYIYGCKDITFGDNSFENCTDLKGLYASDKMLHVRSNAFAGCTNLAYLYGSIRDLAKRSFYNCKLLNSVSTHMDGEIPEECFAGCQTLHMDLAKFHGIGKRAFANSGLASVNLSTCQHIGYQAFEGCSLLGTVTMPAVGFTNGDWEGQAFKDCYGLRTIFVSRQITSSLTPSNFFEGVNLKTVTLHVTPQLYGSCYENLPLWKEMLVDKDFTFPVYGGDATTYYQWELAENGTLKISGKNVSNNQSALNQPWRNYREFVQDIIIESGIQEIGDNAFAELQNLKSVTLPRTVKKIGNAVFRDCSSLETIYITSVEELGNNVFEGCSSLEYIDLGRGLKKAGDYIFKNCTSLQEVGNMENTPAEVTGLTFASIGSQAYQRRGGRPMKAFGQEAITLNVPDEFVTNYIIDRNWGKFHIAFTDSRGTWRHAGRFGDGTWILYDDGTMVVSADKGPGEDYFDNDHQTLGFTKEVRDNTTSIEISGNIDALYNCFTQFDNLETVQLGEKVRKLDGTFYNCPKLREINVNNVDTIIDAFARAQLPMLDLSNVKVLGRYAMYATDITVAKLGKQCDVAKYAFYGCNKLKAIDLGSANLEKAEGCFKGCSSLKYVALNCKKISEQMFSGCSSLTAIRIGANTEVIYDEFQGCTKLDTIYCDSPNPPALPVYDKVVYLNDVNWEYVDARAFDALTLSKIKLVVKREYIPIYRKSEVWKEMTILADDGDDAEPTLPVGGSIGKYGTWNIDANGVLTIDYDGSMYSKVNGVSVHDLFSPYLPFITKVVTTDPVKSLPTNMVGYHNPLLSEDVKSVEIGARMQHLCDSSLNYSGLTDVYCYAITCPLVANGAFDWDAITANNATLHVVNIPGIADNYRKSKTWSRFPNIVGDLESRLPAGMFRSMSKEGLYVWYRVTDEAARTCETYPRDIDNGDRAVEMNPYSSYAMLTIPETVTNNGVTYTVTGIGDQSFAGCSNFDNFTLPSTIESIGVSAFEPLNGMHISDFTLPANLKYIADNAFEMWVGLKRLTVLGQEPPVVGDNAIGMYWDPYMGPKPILLVPGGCRDAWNISPWNEWFTIIDKENPNTLTYKVKPGASFWDYYKNDEEYMCIQALMQVGELSYENEVVARVWEPYGGFWDDIYADVYYNKAHKKLFYLEDGQTIKIFDGVSPADNILYTFKESDYDEMAYTAGENIRLFKAATIIFSESTSQSDVYFSAANEDGVVITYRVLDEQKKTCEVKPDPSGYNTYAVEYGTQNVKIPFEANGYIVLGIAADAFSGMTDLESVTLPSTLRNLGQSAFSYCENLHDVYIYRTNPPMLLDADGFLTKEQNAAFENIGIPAGSMEGWATLHVPDGCTEAYDLEPWTIWFPTIQDDVIDDPVGINEIMNEELGMKNGESWFDLSGRKLSGKPTKAGLYIQNGKKVVVK